MTAESMEQRVRRILAEELGDLGEGTLERDTPLGGRGLGLNSLDLVSVIVRLEAEFDVVFEDDEIATSAATFAALLESLQRKVR